MINTERNKDYLNGGILSSKFRLMLHVPFCNNNNDSTSSNSLHCSVMGNFYLNSIDLQVSQVENVYEEVNEKEYCRRRQDRLEDDWIVDDGRWWS